MSIWDSQGYIPSTEAPIFTPAACEGTTTLFEVQYIDDEKAYLTQSASFTSKQRPMALGKVYQRLGPTFPRRKNQKRPPPDGIRMLEPEAPTRT